LDFSASLTLCGWLGNSVVIGFTLHSLLGRCWCWQVLPSGGHPSPHGGPQPIDFIFSPTIPGSVESIETGSTTCLWPKLGIDAVSIIATGFYIFIVDPFELRPLTLVERQMLSVEVAIVFITFRTFRAGLRRGMGPSSDSMGQLLSFADD
jgi:hypothetical protein